MPQLVDSQVDLRTMPERLVSLQSEILANLVLLGQIPAPTGEEQVRVQFLLDRFAEAGLPQAGRDGAGNAVGLLPGSVGEQTIALVAHLDTIVPGDVDHNITVQADRIIGPGISDNSLGAAVVSIIPHCLDRLGIELRSNLKLLGTVDSLGRGNHQGLRSHLEHAQRDTDFGICLEGVNLGRLDFFSIGTLRGDIFCDVRPAETRSFGSESAIVVLNQIINRMLQINLPQRPFTKIRIGRVRAGVSYDVEPDHAELSFEVNSHADEMIARVEKELADICAEMSARGQNDVTLDCFFRRSAGGIPFAHPLVKGTVEVMETLDIEPDQGHSPSELSEFIARSIPAITIGVTTGEKHRKRPDHVMIEPILRGVAQAIGVILAIDAEPTGEIDSLPMGGSSVTEGRSGKNRHGP